ncbi:MAG: hypothetical protein WAN10_10645 [Candidatus Acidiferrales bacterium]
MRLPAPVATILAAFVVSGCASAVSPLYNKTDAVSDPAIVGTWVGGDKDNQDTVQIERAKDGSYQVTVHDTKSGDDSVYEAHLVKLGNTSFADLLLTDYSHTGQKIDLPAGAVALHEIVKYRVAGDDLDCSSIDGDALEKSAKRPGFPLQLRDTKKSGGDTVILSSTPELRRYFAAHPADIFGEVDHFKRQH